MGYHSYFKGQFVSSYTGDIGKKSFVTGQKIPEALALISGCWGWYRVDEGSGLILHNSSTNVDKFPDLSLYTPSEIGFWHSFTEGFGTSTGTSYGLWTNTTPSNTLPSYHNPTGIFCRVTGGGTPQEKWGIHNEVTGYDRIGANLGIYTGPLILHGAFYAGSGGVNSNYLPDFYNKWQFQFITKVAGTMTHYTVKDDGTLDVGSSVGSGVIPLEVKRISLFTGSYVGTWYYFVGQLADWIFYVDIDVTLTDWKYNYNSLRSRYGMAAPSGW
jgi:hypothetical protein